VACKSCYSTNRWIKEAEKDETALAGALTLPEDSAPGRSHFFNIHGRNKYIIGYYRDKTGAEMNDSQQGASLFRRRVLLCLFTVSWSGHGPPGKRIHGNEDARLSLIYFIFKVAIQ
jgi:hypothetical protein